MNILLFTHTLSTIGGIETSFFELAQYLKSKGHNVGVRFDVASPLQLNRYRAAGIDIANERVERCDLLLIGSVWKQPKLIAAKLTVQQIHADWTDRIWNGAASALQTIQQADRNVDLYACVSESSASFVRKATKKDVIVMNNIAPTKNDIHHVKNDKVVFGAFTRMTAEKGLNNYQAFRQRIIELGIDAEFKIYTPGEAPEGWTYNEPVSDIKDILPTVDYVVSLADTESFGYTIAEANSCGIPCIIKRTNSTAEFFSDKHNLILDDVTAFTKKDLSLKVVAYTLRKDTEKNIEECLVLFNNLQSDKCIIKTTRAFRDLQAGRYRYLGEVFSVTTERAKQLLSNEIKIVEEL